MDLLGFQAEIENAEKNLNWVKVETALEIIRTTLCKIPMVDMRFTYFSDCLYISTDVSEIGLCYLLTSIEQITLDLLYEDVFIRGGLTRGNACHSDHHIYGTAVNRAYQIECNQAKNPRTLLCPKVLEDVRNIKNIKHDVLHKDADGQYFFNFFRIFSNYMPESPEIGKQLMEDPAVRVMDFLIQRLRGHTGGPLEKAKWMAGYWNDVVACKGIFGEISSTVEIKNTSTGAPRSFVRISG